MDEAWTFRDLLAAGWTEADLEWERLSEQALADLSEARDDEAFAAIREALFLARRHFKADDPRLAASLTSQAAAVAAADPQADVDVIVRSATAAWSACDRMVEAMSAPRRARSSLFHLRMERLHRDTYQERWRDEGRRQLAQVRSSLAAADTPRLIGPEEARARLAHWRRERPAALSDPRKLGAAIALLAVRTGDLPAPALPHTHDDARPI